MPNEESCVVRIVNLDDSFTETALRGLILIKCQPQGDVKKIYLKRDDILNLLYAYVVFEYNYDAVKVLQILDGYIHMSNKFQVDLIGPNLNYRKYKDESSELERIALIRRHMTIDENPRRIVNPFARRYREILERKRAMLRTLHGEANNN